MGDATFEAVWHRDRDVLRGALGLSLGDTQLANEAVDEAFTRATARWSRERRLRPVRPVEEPDTAIYGVVEGRAVLAAIEPLPSAQRAVVVLRSYLDWDIAGSPRRWTFPRAWSRAVFTAPRPPTRSQEVHR